MDYKKIDQILVQLQQAYERICVKPVVYTKQMPATETEIKQVEKRVHTVLPISLKAFFRQYSKRITFRAILPDHLILPSILKDVSRAEFEISLEEVQQAEMCRLELLQVYHDVNDTYDRVWHNKLGLMCVHTGDVIAIDLKHPLGDGPVVFLSHDGDESHGCILGRNFKSFFENLLLVGACGNEDWQMLPFIKDAESGIDPYCEKAAIYRKLIQFEVIEAGFL